MDLIRNSVRARLEQARLYLVCDERPASFMQAALSGGVDLVQLRIKEASDRDVLSVAARYRRMCEEAGALFVVNDRPEVAAECGADGVHLGQADASVAEARRVLGEGPLIGLSTHSEDQIHAASGVDYIGVGPVYATPTKPGRDPVGLELVRYAADHASVPFFAIGGINSDNVPAVAAAGASRIAVVRALTESDDPQASAKLLRALLTPRREPVGTP